MSIDSIFGTLLGNAVVGGMEKNPEPGFEPLKQDSKAAEPKNESQAIDPFGVVDSVRLGVGSAKDRAYQADDVLSNAINTINRVQDERMVDATQLVAVKQGVAQEVATETQALGDATKPLFQRRVAIADRKAELNKMNPLMRDLFGIVNRNYSMEYLDSEDAAVSQQLAARGDQYKSLMGLHDQTIQLATDAYNNADSLRQLEVDNETTDVTLAMQAVGSVNQVIQTELQGLEANSKLLQGQAQVRQDLLSSMTPEQINRAHAEAKANGGIATVNGVPLREGELRDVQMNWQEKTLALKSRQLALKSQELGLAEQYEDRAISRMSGPEIEAAIKNGGNFGGQQLNMLKLTNALGAAQQRGAMMAQQAMKSDITASYKQGFEQIAANVNNSGSRVRQLFGQMPKEMQNMNARIAARLHGFNAAADKAIAGGYEAEFRASAMGELASIMKEQNDLNERLAKQWSGGDPDKQALATSWLTGGVIGPDQSARAFLKLAKDGVPAGTKMTPQANAVFQKVAAIAKSNPSNSRNLTPAQMFKIASGKEIDPAQLAAAKKVIVDSYANDSMEEVILSTPAAAKQLNHPFSQVDQRDVAASLKYGDSEGLKAVARKYKLSDQEAEALFSGKGDPTTAQNAAQKIQKAGVDMPTVNRQLMAAQTSKFLEALDHSPSAKKGFKPSAAYVSLMNNPQYQQLTENQVMYNAQKSPVDFAAYQAGGTQFSSAFYNYSQLAAQAQSVNDSNKLARVVNDGAKLRNLKPGDSARMVLHAVLDNETDAERLYQAVMPIAEQYAKTAWQNSPVSNPVQISPADAIDHVITKQSFQDPALEKIRRQAAKDWMTYRPQLYKGIGGAIKFMQDHPDSFFSFDTNDESGIIGFGQ